MSSTMPSGPAVDVQRGLLCIQRTLPAGVLLDLLSRLPYAGEYARLRQLRRVDDRPWARDCAACSRCARPPAVAGSLARHGTADYPGGPMSWTAPAPPAPPALPVRGRPRVAAS